MGPALLIVLALARLQTDAAGEVEALLGEARYAEALARATDVHEAGLAARLEARVRWAAGDLDGALGAAEEGLAAEPRDVALRDLAVDVALALDLAEVAREHLTALEQELDADPPASEARAWWRERCAAHGRATEEAEGRLAARDGALGRSRLVAGVLLVGALAAGLGLARGSGGGTVSTRVPERDSGEPKGSNRGAGR